VMRFEASSERLLKEYQAEVEQALEEARSPVAASHP
jgi:hypothetical protein